MRDELIKSIRATKGLTTDELNELKAHITALLSLGPSSADGITSESNHSDWVLMGLVDYCRRQGMDGAFVSVLTTQKAGYEAWRQKLPDIHKYLRKVGDQTKQRSLLHLGLELLKEDIESRSTRGKDSKVMSAKKLMSEIHRIPGVINRQFPGYLAAGVLHMIIRSEVNVRKKSRKRKLQRNGDRVVAKGTVLHDTGGRTGRR